MLELFPLCIDDCRIFDMFCASLRSLCDGRTGIGTGVTTGVAVEGAARLGKGGGGPVGDVGTGCELPTAGFWREVAEMSPLLGIRCGTTGTDPMGGWWNGCDG